MILTGKKVILFPFENKELEEFVRVHAENLPTQWAVPSDATLIDRKVGQLMADRQNGHTMIWSIYTNNGKSSEICGFVYLENISIHEANVSGVFEPMKLKVPRKRGDKPQIADAEEALNLLKEYAFGEIGLARLETNSMEESQLIGLYERCGFEKEGVLRNKILLNDQLKNLVVHSLVSVLATQAREVK